MPLVDLIEEERQGVGERVGLLDRHRLRHAHDQAGADVGQVIERAVAGSLHGHSFDRGRAILVRHPLAVNRTRGEVHLAANRKTSSTAIGAPSTGTELPAGKSCRVP